MDTVTAVIAVVCLLFIVRGAWRGFGGELAPLVGLVACAGTLWFGYPPLHAALGAALPALEPGACVFYSAVAAALAGMVVFFAVAVLLRRALGLIFPQPFNALLGALVGAAKAVLLISVVAGVLSVAQERFSGLRARSEENPVSAAAAHFWAARFNALAREGESLGRD